MSKATRWERVPSMCVLGDTEPGSYDVDVERTQYGVYRVSVQRWGGDYDPHQCPELFREFRTDGMRRAYEYAKTFVR